MRRNNYSGFVKLMGEEDRFSIIEADNYTLSLAVLKRYEEAKALFRRTIPVAQKVLGESDELTLRLRWCYAEALYKADGATLGDLRQAVTTLEDTARIARRVLGGAHPLVGLMEGGALRNSRAALRAREASSAGRT